METVTRLIVTDLSLGRHDFAKLKGNEGVGAPVEHVQGMLCSLLHDRVAGRHILLFRSTAQDFAMGFSYNVKTNKCIAQKSQDAFV